MFLLTRIFSDFMSARVSDAVIIRYEVSDTKYYQKDLKKKKQRHMYISSITHIKILLYRCRNEPGYLTA